MLAIDELMSTINRISLIVDNSESVDEVFCAMQVRESLKEIGHQIEAAITSPMYQRALDSFRETRKEKE